MLSHDDLTLDQIKCIDWILDGEDALVCADVGTGKTVIALTAIDEFNQRTPDRRWLVLAPLMVCDEVWRTESDLWAHLELKVRVATGDARQRRSAIESDAPIVVMNYENLAWLMEEYPVEPKRGKVPRHPTLPFDCVVLDEIDKLKSVSSARFKAFRGQVEFFKHRIGLTGTPTPNGLLEIWGQTYMVDGGETFGRSFYKWRADYFYPTDYNQHSWAPFPNTFYNILMKLQGLAFRLKAKGLPPVETLPPAQLTLPDNIRDTYKKLERELFIILEDKKGKQRKVDAANEAVVSGKLQQICAGFSYVDKLKCVSCEVAGVYLSEKGDRRCMRCNKKIGKDAIWHSHAKFDWLSTLVHHVVNVSDRQLLVFYHFNEERDELARRFPDMRFLSGASKTGARELIKQWNEGELPLLALHPMSAGHGLNLQKSGASDIAFLTLPWSGGMFKQVTGRLARRGSTAERVTVHSAVFADTVDVAVLQTVTGRLTGNEDFLDGIH